MLANDGRSLEAKNRGERVVVRMYAPVGRERKSECVRHCPPHPHFRRNVLLAHARGSAGRAECDTQWQSRQLLSRDLSSGDVGDVDHVETRTMP